MPRENIDKKMKRLQNSGFKKELTYKYFKRDGTIIWCTEVDFYARDFPCNSCGTDAYRLLKPERTGVIVTCAFCKRTNGPITRKAGVQRERYKINVDEAIAILEARNAHQRDIAEIAKARNPQTDIRAERERPNSIS